MKSVRLSESSRSQILKLMLEDYNKTTPPPITTEQLDDQAANDLWRSVYGKVELSKIPKELLNYRHSIKAQIDGQFVCFRSINQLPAPSSACKVFDKQPPFYKKYIKLKAALKKWSDKRADFRAELRAVLASCDTTRQLVDIWPEAIKYVPQGHANQKTCNLPALKTETLNKNLGIKVAS